MIKKCLFALTMLILPVVALASALPVVASFSILADLTRQVGGDRVQVRSLVGPDEDAHVFQPSPTAIRQLAGARVFVVNGLGLEGWMSRLSRAASFSGVTVVASKGIVPLAGDEHEPTDPHAWNDR